MPKLSKIVNIGVLNRKNIDFDILHFTKKQWEGASKGLRLSKDLSLLPKKGGMLEVIPNPDGSQNMFIHCPEQGPDNLCKPKRVFDPQTGGINIEGCICKPKKTPGTPGGGGGTIQPLPQCAVSISAQGIRCVRVNCRGTCRFRGVRFQGRLFLFCGCG